MERSGSTKRNIPARSGSHSFHRIGGMSPFLSTNPSLPIKKRKMTRSSRPMPLARLTASFGGGTCKNPKAAFKQAEAGRRWWVGKRLGDGDGPASGGGRRRPGKGQGWHPGNPVGTDFGEICRNFVIFW
jgi:hypothetical protein